jgi:hypothetical protein
VPAGSLKGILKPGSYDFFPEKTVFFKRGVNINDFDPFFDLV